MSINKKSLMFFFLVLFLFVIAMTILVDRYTYIFEGPDPMDHLSHIKDPVERENALRHYWGRKLTHMAFKEMFGVDIQDGGVAQYSLQLGSADGDKEAIATAYYIGNQPAGLMSDMRIKLIENYEKYYSKSLDEIDKSKKDDYFKSILYEYGPSFSGRYNGIYLIEKNGDIFADFNGIHLPMKISIEYLTDILETIKPQPVLSSTAGGSE